jgi:hypothetical protein
MKDFNRATLARLAAKGISVIGICAIPGDGDMPWATASRGYKLNDNGCHRIRSFSEVLEMAA